MYQIHVQTWVDGVRQQDSILTKEYVRLRNAEKAAKKCVVDATDHNGKHLVREAVVLPAMTSVARNEAREAYCKCKDVWVNDNYGRHRLTPSWGYGSHASAESLFARSIEQSVGWHYEGPYYVAY